MTSERILKMSVRQALLTPFTFVLKGIFLLVMGLGLGLSLPAQSISFSPSGLAGESLNNPTSLQFGPDGRLYVSQQNGFIYAYDIVRNGPSDYAVTATETIDLIRTIPNHNQDGSIISNVNRQVTGILVAGTAANPILYVTSSDPRIGGGGSGNSTGLDENSGVISRLTWTGSAWDMVHLVRGLPRSEENHALNGLQLDAVNNILYVAAGGHTNKGAPSNNFAFIPEFAYSAAILSVDLTAIDALPTQTDAQGQQYKYDLPTLDDEDKPNVSNPTPGYEDPTDPWGGNDGKNQAMLVPGGPVQVYSSGWRNHYDLLLTTSNRLYTFDNGPNTGWGGTPINGCSNDINEANSNSKCDNLHYVSGPGYYGGHPNPTRANRANTFNATNPQTPIPAGMEDPFCDYRDPLTQDGALATVCSSTNGLCEYTASNFNGQLQGNLLAAAFNGNIVRFELNAAGDQVLSQSNLFSGFGATPLDVIAQPDAGPFPGTVWACTYGSDNITIFEPLDFVNCVGNDPSFVLDFDNDGYSNGDELANGTDQCSPASIPDDWDGDFLSDIIDNDDDNDGILDNVDLFARDADNGATTTIPIDYLFDNSIDPGINGWGFTGLMTNYTDDYMDLFDPFNMTVGGAALKFTVDSVPPGDALGSLNNQEYAFQFGVNVGNEIGPYTINGRIQGRFANQVPIDFQSYGFFLGTGDQDNYLKVVMASNGGTGGLEVVYEENGGGVGGSGLPVQTMYPVPGLLASTFTDVYLTVDPNTNTVQPKYSIDGGPITNLGPAISIPSSWISNVLAVGFISTSRGATTSFPKTYDYLKVNRETITATGQWYDIIPTSGSATNRHENTWAQVGDKWYLVGGRGNKPVDIYDPSTGAWTTGAQPPIEMHHFQGIEYDGNLWVVGAFNGGFPTETPLPNIYIYNPAADSWHLGPEIPVNRRRGSAGVVVYQDEIYLVCGIQNGHQSGWVPWVDKFNPRTGVWTQLADAPIERDHYHAALHNGKIYNIGGRQSGNGSTFSFTIGQLDVYDIATNSWVTKPASQNIPTERAGCFSAVIGDEVIIAGGESGTQANGHEETEAYHVNNESWRSLANMIDGRHGTSMLENNGVLYVAAGSGNRGGGPELNTIEAFAFFGLRPPTEGYQLVASSPASVPASHDFGTVTAPQTALQTFVVTNNSPNQGVYLKSLGFVGDPVFTSNFAGSLPYYLEPGDSLVIDVTFTPTSSQGYSGALVIDHMGAGGPLSIPLLGGGAVDLALYRINANGPQFTDTGARTFAADAFFTGGQGTNNSGLAIANTLDDPLYQLYRYNNFSYDFPVPTAGDYQVILHFSENWSGANGANLRVFDVVAEGNVVLDDYDIWVEAGFQTAIQETLTVNVSDGILNLQWVNVIQNAKVAAIEVLGPISGGSAELVVNPNPLHFFSQNVGTTSAAQSLVLTNLGAVDSALTVNSITIGGPDAGDFALTFTPPAVIAGGASASVPFTFTPTAIGLRAAYIVINHTATSSPDTIPLTGEGIAPQMTASIQVIDTLACAGDNDGSLWVELVNGQSPFTYAWSNGATTDTITGLAPGSYGVTVTDALNQVATDVYVLSVDSLFAGVSACVENGSANAYSLPSGGTAPYAWLWSANAGSSTNDTVFGLANGTYAVTVTDANGCTAFENITIDANTAVCDTCALPANWANQDIGAVAAAGATCYNNVTDTWYVDGSGADIWTTADEFQYAYTPLNGDGEIIARITSITNTDQWAKSGVMMRDNLNANSKNIMMLKRGGAGLSYQWRSTDGGGSSFANGQAIPTFPVYVRLVRSGNSFTGFHSPDGISWTQLGAAQNIPMGQTIYVGLAVTSHNDGVLNFSTFDNVQVLGSAAVVASASVTSNYNGADISCSGGTDGEATVSVSQGTAPFTYQWDANAGSQTSAVATGLGAGTYSVTVTDANNSTAIAVVTLTQPTLLQASALATDVSCNASADGSIDLTVAGGTTPYAFAWSNSAVTEDLSGLAAGTYSVTVTDANGCTASASATVNSSPTITLSISGTDPSCNGGADGDATVLPSGGLAPYTYLWDANTGGQTSASATGLAGGSYSVTVTDANGCTATGSATLVDPAPIAVIFTPSTFGCGFNVSCNGAADGSVVATASGGTAPYSYFWGTTAPTVIRVNTGNGGAFTAGNGDVFAADNAANYTIIQTPQGQYTNNAIVDVLGTADDQLYRTERYAQEFSYNFPVSNGAYTVVLHFAEIFHGATGTSSQPGNVGDRVFNVDIEGSPFLTNYDIIADVGTMTAVTKTAVVTVTDGELNIGFLGLVDFAKISAIEILSLGGASASLSGVPAGTYLVTVTDANGCTAVDSVSLTEPDPLLASVVVDQDESCLGLLNGQLTASATGGCAPYAYAWDAAAGNQTTATAAGLAGGAYSVTITDANGCSSTASGTVAQGGSLSISASVDADVSCFGGADGQATAAVNSGTAPFAFQWDAAAGNQTTATATGLSAGTYTVVVTDANGCGASASVTIVEPTAISIATSTADPACNGGSDGQATAIASGGTAPFAYLWDANAGSQTAATATGLGAGTYSVTVTDANNCTATASLTLTEPAPISVALTPTTYGCGFNVSCNGASDGGVVAAATGGTAPYAYQWGTGAQTVIRVNTGNGGSFTTGNGDVFAADNPANYTVITVPQGQYTNNNIVDVLGTADDQLYRTERYGKEFNYNFPVPNGTYSIVLHFAEIFHGATGTPSQPGNVGDRIMNVSIEGNSFLSNYDIIADVGTMTAVTKTAVVQVSDDTLNINFFGVVDNAKISAIEVLSLGSSTATLSNVPAGNYNLTVTDANGCTLLQSVTLTEPAPLLAAVSVDLDESCAGSLNGQLTASANGGCAPYTFAWDAAAGNQTTATAVGLAAGTYSVTITDANGCTDVATATVGQGASLTVSISNNSDVSCFGGSDGQAAVTASSGTPPYAYQWDAAAGNQTTAIASGLAAGSYTVVVTDANGCDASATVTISEPSSISLSTSTVDPACNGGSDGQATAIASGGTAPFAYLWDANAGSQATATATGLAAGTYTVSVTDAKGCVETASVSVTEPSALSLSLTSPTFNCGANVSCNGGNDGSISAAVAGGTAPYSYAWGSTIRLNAGNQGGYTTVSGDVFAADGFVSSGAFFNTGAAIANTTDDALYQSERYGNMTYSIPVSNGSYDVNLHFAEIFGGAQTIGARLFDVEIEGVLVLDDYDIFATAGFLTAVVETFSVLVADGSLDIVFTTVVDNAKVSAIEVLPVSSSNSTLNNLSAGTYPLEVTDANGCTVSSSFQITEPALLAASAVVDQDESCGAALDGQATASATGGCAPYTYAWDPATGNQTSATATGLAGGSYTVTITDANGCSATASVNVGQGAAVTASAVVDADASCFGGADGQATASAGSGVAPFTFQWDAAAGNQTSATATGLAAGTYTVVVTDVNGCNASASVTISEPAAISIQTSTVDVSCNGGLDGQATAIVSGGTGAYSYQWDANAGNQTTATATGLGAGTYTLSLTDGNGCVETAIVTIAEPAPIGISLNATTYNCGFNISCNGAADGNVTATATGGTAPYSYAWGSGAAIRINTGNGGVFTAGNGDVYSGDNASFRTIIQTPTGAYANNNIVDVLGTNDDQLYRTERYAKEFSYNIPVPNGNYQVVLHFAEIFHGATGTPSQPGNPGDRVMNVDIEGAPFLSNFDIIAEVGTMTAVQKVANVVVSDGVLDLNFLGVVDNAKISAIEVLEIGGTSANLSGVPAGTYSVTVTDANGCVSTANVTLTEPAPVLANASGQDESCFGASDGSATATPTGGCAPYAYLWDANAGSQTGGTASNLAAGTYAVTVTDANGCSAVGSATVGSPAALVASAVESLPISIFGAADGQATASATGGTSPYSFAWDANAGNQTTATATGLSSGTYSVTVTDANGCTATASLTLVDPISNVSVSLAETASVLCAGGLTGELTATATGGLLPYTYQWSANAGGQTTAVASSLGAGTYSVTVTDGNNSQATASYVLAEPAAYAVSSQAADILCFGDVTGSIDLTVAGATPPYSYSWSNGATTEDISGIGAGTYTVTITDALGCTFVQTDIVEGPNPLAVTFAVTNVNCFGEQTGAIQTTTTGGTPAYSYQWSNGGTADNIAQLQAGVYAVTITDANGCTLVDSVEVITAPPIVLASQPTDVQCAGLANGAIDLIASGGTGAFSYQWSNGATTEDISGLSGGIFSVTVTDANNCVATLTDTINEPDPYVLSFFTEDESCPGLQDGSVDLTVQGGTAPYTYFWSNIQFTQDISGLQPGIYTVVVTDANGCQTAGNSVINTVPFLSLSLSGTDVSCFNGTDGSIDLSVTGGSPGYTYLWSNGGTSQDLSGIPAGNYSVTVLDSNLCSTSDSIVITQPGDIFISATANPISCSGGSDGAIDLTVFGGTAPYAYAWSNSSTAEDQSGLAAGTYAVTVTDGNGCEKITSLTLADPAPLALSAIALDANCAGQADGGIDLSVSGGTAPYSFLWSNGSTLEDPAGLLAGTYNVVVTDANGCTETISATVSEPAALAASIAAVDETCAGQGNGSIDLTISGGTAPYSFLWSNGATSEDLSNLAAGSYSVTATDANGCTVSLSGTVNSPAGIALSANAADASCAGDSDGSIDLSVSGGTAPYAYAWSNSSTTEDLAGIPAGNYAVTVTDANGCTASLTVSVAEPALLVATAVETQPSACISATGEALASAAGGQGPYAFLWDANAGNQITATATALAGGTYSVTVTDANGCESVATVTITGGSNGGFAFSATDVSCNGFSDGSIVATGGTAPYTYTIASQSAISQAISNNQDDAEETQAGNMQLGNGDIDLGFDNNNNGFITAGLRYRNLNIPQGATILSARIQFTTFGTNNQNPSVLTIAGEAADNSGQFQNVANNITSRAQTSSSVGWSPAAWNLVGEAGPDQLTPDLSSIVQEVVNRPGWASGNALSFFVDGTGRRRAASRNGSLGDEAVLLVEYISNGNSNTNLAPGTYFVTAVDANGCSSTDTVVIGEPALLTVAVTGSDPLCGNSSDGSASAVATGGLPPYTYQWDAAANNQTASTASNLSAGAYSVVVTDANGCTATGTVTLSAPVGIAASISEVDESCPGANDGSIDLAVSGGSQPYTYLWSNASTSEDLAGISAGTYDVTITDANGCTATASGTVSAPNAIQLSAVVTDVACFSLPQGGIDLSVSGGTAPYTYQWSNNATTEDINFVVAGTYSVTVTDVNGCSATASATVAEPAALAVSFSTTDPTCAGDSNGTATAIASGGTPPYTYLWPLDGGQTTATATGLAAGPHTVKVFDANLCEVSGVATLADPAPLALSIADASCFGEADGSVVATGGTAPYTYSVSSTASFSLDVPVDRGNDDAEERANGSVNRGNNDLELVFDGPTNGLQTVGTMFRGLQIPQGATITNAYIQFTAKNTGNQNPSALTIAAHDANNAALIQNAANDLSSRPLTTASVSWSPANWTTAGAAGLDERTPDISSVVQEIVDRGGWNAGNRMLFILTGTGRRRAFSFNGNQAGAPVLHIEWTTSSSSGNTGLVAGNYDVTVTDANGCSVTLPATINEPAQLSVTASESQATSSSSSNDGEATAAANGGTPPYSYQWDANAANQTTAVATGLGVGIYSVTVTDANGCTATDTAAVNVLSNPLAATASVTGQILCAGDLTGEASVSATGGLPPYSYLWDANAGGQTTATATGLAAGTYTVTVTDASSATATANVTIGEPAALQLSASGVTCSGDADGQVLASGGTAPYVISVAGSSGSVSSQPSATADDAEQAINGGAMNTGSSSLEMGWDNNDPNDPQLVGIRFPVINIPQGAIITSASIEFISDDNASNVANLNLFGEASDDAAVYTNASNNIGSRALTAASTAWTPGAWSTGQSYTSPDISSLVQEIVARGGWSSGNALAVVVSGTGYRNARGFNSSQADAPTLSVTWTTAQDPNALLAGDYEVTVIDANGCSFTDSINVGSPDQIAVVTTTAACGQDGQIYATGGTGPLTLTISGGGSVSIPVATGADDAEQTISSGAMLLSSSSLEMGFDNNDPNDPQYVGLRFLGVNVPQGVTITGATLGFTALTSESTATSLAVNGNDVDDAAPITGANSDLSSRVTTSAIVPWLNVPAWTAGQTYSSPDISAVVQEIVDRPGWNSGNAMVFTVKGQGFRNAAGFENGAASAPVLNITWSAAPQSGDTLQVSAGSYLVSVVDANGCSLVDTVEVADNCNPCAYSRVTDGLIAFYPFVEGSGNTVHDLSGFGAPLDLEIANTSNVNWLAGNGVSVNSATIIEATASASKIATACAASNELTVEAWVIPANTSQGGPSRIVTFSEDPFERNWTLGQEGDEYIGRIRTSSSNTNGLPDLSTNNNNSVSTSLQHVVMTRAASGAWTIYVDGVVEASGNRGGNLGNWDASYGFALANELTNDRPWLGEIRLVAVYDKALSPAEIAQNLSAGAGCSGNFPPVAFCQADANTCEDPLEVAFDGSGSVDGDGSIVSYAWDFGDGNGSSLPSPTHTYAAAGSYTATLVVTDDQGASDTCSQTLTLSNAVSGRYNSNIVAFYTFTEGNGSVVNDVSGFGAPLNLTIQDPSNVTWNANGSLSINSGTTINSGVPATKVLTSCQSTNEITIEAWVTPANTSQSGPARIVTMSQNTGSRDWTLGQEGDEYITRLRTTATNNQGTPDLSTANNNAVSTSLQHVVFTRSAGGAWTLYVDGVAEASGTRGGNFSNWDGGYQLALANELTNNRDWLGELHLVAIFNEALTTAEVQQNFAAGPDCIGNLPPVASIQQSNDLCADPLAYAFDGSGSTDGDGSIVSYAWDFGDGAVSTAANPSHTYAGLGTYTVTLTVTDNDGGIGSATYTAQVLTTLPGRVDNGLVVLYDFRDGSGNVVSDVSGVGSPMDLTIQNTNNVTWTGNNTLQVNSGTVINSVSPATKVLNACQATNEITVEAWVTPANTSQGGPARIVTMSQNTGVRNWTLGQEGDEYITRLRTTATNNQGTPDLSTANNNSVSTSLQHVVFTRSAGGAWALYVDGALEASGTRGGNFGNWDSGYQFALANELTNNRAWLGELHLVAVYNDALTAAEIAQNYAVGPDCGGAAAKISTGDQPEVPSGVSLQASVEAFPNPFENDFSVRLDAGSYSGLVEFAVYDLTGRVVAERTVQVDGDVVQEQFSLVDFTSGSYVLVVRAGGFSRRMTIVKQ